MPIVKRNSSKGAVLPSTCRTAIIVQKGWDNKMNVKTTGDGRQTPRKNFRIPILQVLRDAGTHISRHETCQRVGERMTFVPADLERRPDGAEKWVRKVGYVTGTLRHDGLVEPAARNGNCISEKGLKYLQDTGQ
jgi:hypothetical protein